MALFFYCFINDLIEKQGLRWFPDVGQERCIRVKAFHFLDAKDIGILFVVHDEVQQHQGLIKGDQASGGFRANPIDDVALQSKQFGKNSDDNGSLSIFGEAKDNAAGFMSQNFQNLRISEWRAAGHQAGRYVPWPD